MATGTPSSGNTPNASVDLGLPRKGSEVPGSDSVRAAVPFALIVQHDFRRRLNDLIGLGLLTSAALLSFTGLVDLSRSMHPVRFVLVLCTAFGFYRVLTNTFGSLRLTDAGIERSSPLTSIQFRPYDQLAEIAAIGGKSLRLRFKDGSIWTIDRSMPNASDLVEFFDHRAGQSSGKLATKR